MTVKPGYLVHSDMDGVLVNPCEIAYEVLVRAEEIKEKEKLRFGWVREGKFVHEITEN